MRKVRWGVLGVAGIAVRKVIPAMQRGQLTEITAIASRTGGKAEQAAELLGIPKAYASYEDLLADPEIEAIYNPLPNHLHVPWSIRCAEAGKHVLCEKPISLTVEEARGLLAVRDRTGVKMGEAFMVRTHPQWLRVRELVRLGRIGKLRSAIGFFSYTNVDPQNIRNIPVYGGGGLMDIGCYPINLTRFIFEEEPRRVLALLEPDPEMQIDRLSSAILEYPSGHATFTCSTQLVPYQTMQFFGTTGRVAVKIPFNAPPDRSTRIFINDQTEEFEPCDQYTLQGDLFSQAIRGEGEVPVPLEDAIRNMAVIEALFRSMVSGTWESVE